MHEREVNVFDEVHACFRDLLVLGGEASLGESFGERDEAQTISKVLGQIGDSNVLGDITIRPEGEGLHREWESALDATKSKRQPHRLGMRVSYLDLHLFPGTILGSHATLNKQTRSRESVL